MTADAPTHASFVEALAPLASRDVILFGGKGGVGKTTVSVAAALHFAETRPTILFTTDPASNLADLLGDTAPGQLTIESLDAAALYERFLAAHLESFLEIGDRGTYLDREELRRLFALVIPGMDELMAWMHIGELAEAHDGIVVVDTAPTGHTLRMLSSSEHFRRVAVALDAMQEKHRTMVRQFTRRDVRDAIDAFIDDFDARARSRRELLTDPSRAAFVPVMLSEPLVVEQTIRLVAEVAEAGIDVPLVILNRAIADPDCERDRARARRDDAAREQLAPRRVADAPRACAPLDHAEAVRTWSRGEAPSARAIDASQQLSPRTAVGPIPRLTFLAGKGGVGKTSCAASIALQLALRNREKRYVVLSVDPAHSLPELFEADAPPPNLSVETIDTRAKWARFRENVGRQIENAMDALTPRGLSVAHDAEAMRRLVEIAPPGADELFALTRLANLIGDEAIDRIIVDTAPTGHFLRLLDLPRVAGEWVREFMRLLLRYRELIPAGSLGEELVRASRALKEVDATLASDRAAVVVVTRPERIVVAETRRLMQHLRERGVRIAGVIANYVAPESACACDRALRQHELAALGELGEAAIVERRDEPPSRRDELESLVSLAP